jgi:hypothetical protein
VIIEAVTKRLAGLSWRRTENIFRISRRGAAAVLIMLGTPGPTAALGGYSATRSSISVAVFSHPTRPDRQRMSPRWTDPSDGFPTPSGEDRVLDQFHENLTRETARVLNLHE